MTLALVTGPAELPITTAEAKSHLVVDHADDDDLIDAMIGGALKLAETRTNRQLVSATYDYKLARFADLIQLPRPPLSNHPTNPTCPPARPVHAHPPLA